MWWMFLSTALAGGPEVDLGLSLSGGGLGHFQDATAEAAWSVDVLDLEIHVGDWQVVPRLGRFALGVAALQIVDVEVDVFYRFTPPSEGWSFLGAAGLGPRLVVGADQVSGGIRALGRLGATWRKRDGKARIHLFGEPFAGVDAGPEFVSGDVGARLGVAFTWRVRR